MLLFVLLMGMDDFYDWHPSIQLFSVLAYAMATLMWLSCFCAEMGDSTNAATDVMLQLGPTIFILLALANRAASRDVFRTGDPHKFNLAAATLLIVGLVYIFSTRDDASPVEPKRRPPPPYRPPSPVIVARPIIQEAKPRQPSPPTLPSAPPMAKLAPAPPPKFPVLARNPVPGRRQATIEH